MADYLRLIHQQPHTSPPHPLLFATPVTAPYTHAYTPAANAPAHAAQPVFSFDSTPQPLSTAALQHRDSALQSLTPLSSAFLQHRDTPTLQHDDTSTASLQHLSSASLQHCDTPTVEMPFQLYACNATGAAVCAHAGQGTRARSVLASRGGLGYEAVAENDAVTEKDVVVCGFVGSRWISLVCVCLCVCMPVRVCECVCQR